MLGIIGGSGLYVGLEGLTDCNPGELETVHGKVSFIMGALEGVPMVFLSRHKSGGRLMPPHRIDHRANVGALKDMGVDTIIATATVGALADDVGVGDLVAPDQYIDLSGMPSTFHDGGDTGLLHMDMTEPFCPSLRGLIAAAGQREGLTVRDGGVYTCIAGPQFETIAEASMLRKLGGTVAGMTVVPEAKLAREAGICYQPVALVVNRTGETSPEHTHENTVEVMGEKLPGLAALLRAATSELGDRPGCKCPRVPVPYKG